MDPKALKKLVKTCREMGITHYKGPDFEFTLSHDAPVKTKKSKKGQETEAVGSDFETDSLTPEQLLMWSASGGLPFDVTPEEGA